MRWLLVLLLALLTGPLAAQGEPKPVYYGVWKGTVGTYPVIACMDQDGLGKARGAYYYVSHLTPIGLAGRDDGPDWDEAVDYAASGARWHAVAVKGDVLWASWVQGGKTLPVRLARQTWTGGEEFDGPCMGDAFIAPRAGGGSVASADASFDGVAYRKLTYVPGKQFGENGSIETLALLSDAPGDKAINALLARDLPDGGWRSDFIQCLSFEVANSGSDGYFGLTVEPDLITGRWLDLTIGNENSCGGVHPNAWSSFRTFDRQSGAEVNLFRWLNAKAVEHVAGDKPEDGYDKLLPPLRDLTLEYASADAGDADPDCPAATRDAEFWYLGLAKDGLQLIPSLPHVIQACADSYVVPWRALAPYLSDEGKAGAAVLRAG
ncbi:MAG: hypothetical protein P0Y56_07060 [Candidatus Andeanibacterium colombiense]|uniref:DUF3298 domain-containing protein n=1 Tax=Candidatus Andeanibacterium colombiense TaxID=3121345 RepID=A0AAJ5XAX7_9SPHN|nr:MAG: hypothetical protein P0Y56_07060 [Sphingomonadaceae bacterium]